LPFYFGKILNIFLIKICSKPLEKIKRNVKNGQKSKKERSKKFKIYIDKEKK